MTLQAALFLVSFLFILGLYIAFIRSISRRYSDRMALRIHETGERVIIAGIISGVIAMFQPWFFVPYRIGFIVVLVATLTFIVWSHIAPAQAVTEE